MKCHLIMFKTMTSTYITLCIQLWLLRMKTGMRYFNNVFKFPWLFFHFCSQKQCRRRYYLKKKNICIFKSFYKQDLNFYGESKLVIRKGFRSCSCLWGFLGDFCFCF